MPLPQGINFRATSGYVTDGANEDAETFIDAFGAGNYPRTSAQGNTVGWESGSQSLYSRDRVSTQDQRLAGLSFEAGNGYANYRIDLLSPGTHNIRAASGDGNYSGPVSLDLYDSTASLGSLMTGSTSAANHFKDATDTEYSAAAWPGSNTAVAKTFASTICRFRLNPAVISDNVRLCHVYIENAGGGAAVPIMGQICM